MEARAGRGLDYTCNSRVIASTLRPTPRAWRTSQVVAVRYSWENKLLLGNQKFRLSEFTRSDF